MSPHHAPTALLIVLVAAATSVGCDAITGLDDLEVAETTTASATTTGAGQPASSSASSAGGEGTSTSGSQGPGGSGGEGGGESGGGGSGGGGSAGCFEIELGPFAPFDELQTNASFQYGDASTHVLSVQLDPAVSTGRVPLGEGDNDDVTTCTECVAVFLDLDPEVPGLFESFAFATSGTLVLDADPTGLATLEDVTFLETDFGTGELIEGGLCFHLAAASLHPGWSCDVEGWDDTTCSCACGAPDPYCAENPDATVYNCLEGQTCNQAGECIGDPDSWSCEPGGWNDGEVCHCECSPMDPDCFDLRLPVAECPDETYACDLNYCVATQEFSCANFEDDDDDDEVDCGDATSCQGMPECAPGSVPFNGPCTVSSDCVSLIGSDPACIDGAAEFSVGAPFCSEWCDVGTGECGQDAICWAPPAIGWDEGLCMTPCTTSADCPASMDCVEFPAFPPTVCMTTTAPPEWTCAPTFYDFDGECDCGCGVHDPDCPGTSVGVCDYCDDPGSCSNSQCDGIDPSDNGVCL